MQLASRRRSGSRDSRHAVKPERQSDTPVNDVSPTQDLEEIPGARPMEPRILRHNNISKSVSFQQRYIERRFHHLHKTEVHLGQKTDPLKGQKMTMDIPRSKVRKKHATIRAYRRRDPIDFKEREDKRNPTAKKMDKQERKEAKRFKEYNEGIRQQRKEQPIKERMQQKVQRYHPTGDQPLGEKSNMSSTIARIRAWILHNEIRKEEGREAGSPRGRVERRGSVGGNC